MKTILISLFLLSFSFCKAQSWTMLFEQKNGTYYYKPNTDDTAWIKIVSDKTEYIQPSKKGKTVDGYRVILYKFSCRSRKIGIIKASVYSSEGDVLDSFSENEVLVEMDYVNPDSVGESLLELFCKQ